MPKTIYDHVLALKWPTTLMQTLLLNLQLKWPVLYGKTNSMCISTTHKTINKIYRRLQISHPLISKAQASKTVFRILFQSIVQNLGGLNSSLGPLYRDPGVSFGQMISEFLKENKWLEIQIQFAKLSVQNQTLADVYLVGRLGEHSLFPEIRGQIAVRL